MSTATHRAHAANSRLQDILAFQHRDDTMRHPKAGTGVAWDILAADIRQKSSSNSRLLYRWELHARFQTGVRWYYNTFVVHGNWSLEHQAVVNSDPILIATHQQTSNR